MKKDTVTLNGKKWNVGFDFHTMLAFEEIAGHAIESISALSTKDNAILLYASIMSFNDDVPEFDEFMHHITNLQALRQLNEAVAPHVVKFFEIPEIAEKPQKESKDSKNA